MEKYVCIHGHFYQPPRENPWLEDIELQDSAYPYHDWNAKITQDCYRQNAASRILGADRKIVDIVNNYMSISFNFGPTLLHWLESHKPEVYQAILEADKESQEHFSGHGAAIAQCYNHMIMPLANPRDKHTQAVWAMTDFESRFGRKPEGMWLPETAVDLETLEILAELGIKFTILAPRQAKQIRKIGGRKWKEVKEDNFDTTVPYLCNLPSGKTINLFLYNGSVAHDVAYGGLLHSGENFANRLVGTLTEDDSQARLANIATDGESFGHHHHHGDMALAYCLHFIKANNLAKVTIYGEYLEKFPPIHEVQIWENSSWSCVHGVERWRSNCGCCADQSLSGKQQWREPLRKTLDWLRDNLAGVYEKRMSEYSSEPWEVRNQYIRVINNRTVENIANFIAKVTGKQLDDPGKCVFLKLLEMQRNAMLMYTSCGWFFDNISGIETVQVIQYASRSMQLCREVEGVELQTEFKEILKQAPANVKGLANGKEVYEAYVEPTSIDLHRVGAHFALSSIFEEKPDETRKICCYSTQMENHDRVEAGIQILDTGRANIQSNITLDEATIDFAVLHLGDHNLIAALTAASTDETFQQTQEKLKAAFQSGDTNETMRQMNIMSDGNTYSITHLFKDNQRRILHKLLQNTWQEIEASFRHIYEHNYAIMLMMRGMNMPLPKALSTAAEFIINEDLCSEIRNEEVDIKRLESLTEEASRLSVNLDETTLRFEGSSRINRFMNKFEGSVDDVELLSTVERMLDILGNAVSNLDLQAAQNIFFVIAKERYSQMKQKATSEDKQAQRWVELFESMAGHLGLVIE